MICMGAMILSAAFAFAFAPPCLARAPARASGSAPLSDRVRIPIPSIRPPPSIAFVVVVPLAAPARDGRRGGRSGRGGHTRIRGFADPIGESPADRTGSLRGIEGRGARLGAEDVDDFIGDVEGGGPGGGRGRGRAFSDLAERVGACLLRSGMKRDALEGSGGGGSPKGVTNWIDEVTESELRECLDGFALRQVRARRHSRKWGGGLRGRLGRSSVRRLTRCAGMPLGRITRMG